MATKYNRAPSDQVQHGPRVYGYCRVSTDRQADSGISLDEQERKIEARCLEQGWRLEHVYVDAGVSGSTRSARRRTGGRSGIAMTDINSLDAETRCLVLVSKFLQNWAAMAFGDGEAPRA
jgi:hypothetical protein